MVVATTRRPTTSGTSPRRVVSTSGSSGINREFGRRGACLLRCRIYPTLFGCPPLRCARRGAGQRLQQRRKSTLAHFRRFAVAAAFFAAAAPVTFAVFAHGQSLDPGRPPERTIVPPPESTPPKAPTPDAGLSPDSTAPQAPKAGLSPELMYRILLGEVALQRGEPALAARAYLEAARETRDPSLAKRATEIAVGARARSLSVESARLWSEIDPSAQRPKQLIAALSGGTGAKGFDIPGVGNDLKAELERVLAEAATSPAALGDAFLQLNRLLSSEPDKQATLRLVESVAQPYPDLAEARFAVALAADNTGLTDLSTSAIALKEVDRALILKPGWERAAMLKADILGKRSPAEAIAYLLDYVKAHPDSKAAAGSLAQFYVQQKRYGEARAIFERFWAADKSNRDYEFAIAALAFQM